MNHKENILNAWIAIEQLSEGDIKIKELTPFDQNIENYQKYLLDVIDEGYKKERSKNPGVVVFFDIFDFENIIDILKRTYNIEDTQEDIFKSNKFTFAIYFDKDLKLIEDKFFYTISGYIRRNNSFPDKNFEQKKGQQIFSKFKEKEKDFNSFFEWMITEHNFDVNNCKYKFVKNLETVDPNLHSFFIDDLNKAKTIDTENLRRYLSGFDGKKEILDFKIDSVNFNPGLLNTILDPTSYPSGRFPGKTEYALSLMQQVAVNIALNEKDTIRSVNGPPGTGKTTLLKEIFADLIVQQAKVICNMKVKKINGSLNYRENAKLGVLPTELAEKNIVVASSNNGAVQNIVNEIPLLEGIDEKFIEKIDYFKEISNSSYHLEWIENSGKKEKKLKRKFEADTKWGVFSIEGGKQSNMGNLLLTIKLIEDELKHSSYDLGIYNEFDKLYRKVVLEKEKVKRLINLIKELDAKSHQLSENKTIYFKQLEEKEKNIKKLNQEVFSKKKELEDYVLEIKLENRDLKFSLAQKRREQESLKDKQNAINLNKPNFFVKFFNRSRYDTYKKDILFVSEELIKVVNAINRVETRIYELQKVEQKLRQHYETLKMKAAHFKKELNMWKSSQYRYISNLKDELLRIKSEIGDRGVNSINYNQSYDKLQKCNPWFTEDFRLLQSELFIKALEVRKAFLYENIDNIHKSREIWREQGKYFSHSRQEEILQSAWNWVNFTIPVISTTFASFGRMFKNLNENSIANLFIDEAGQALPQASIGAILRSKRVMVVGDPSQIEPVLTLGSNVLNLINRINNVNEKFVSLNVSTQTLVDDASRYGYKKLNGDWIGIPLWVHRRSKDPMFTISNEISYDGLMVQGKDEHLAKGKADWIDISGTASDKFVREQAKYVKEDIQKRIKEDPSIASDIYVISPFRNVAKKLSEALISINFVKKDKNGKPENVGTVHTFQGKEAKIVYFVLGADKDSAGSARWAVSTPNIVNVAVTRAKDEFYVVGEKDLYLSLGSNVANIVDGVIDSFNK